MSFFDGNASEMPGHRPVDDGAIEAALAGNTRGAGSDSLSSFVSAVRSAAEVVPTPSTAMAAVLTAGLSTVKGDLSATAASNVNGPASQEAGLPKWRKAYMKIQGFIAGLGVVGKVALGVGVAAAATTGAGAAGVLPFSMPGHAHHRNHAVVLHSTTTTTTKKSTPKAALHAAAVPHVTHGRRHTAVPHHASTASTTTTVTSPAPVYPPPVTSTTLEKTTPTTPTTGTTPTTDTTPTTGTTPTTETPTTVYEPPSTTSTTTTPTTQPPGGNTPTQSIQLSCTATGATQVTCTWTAAPGGVAKYSLWRWTTGGNGSDYGSIYESPDGLTFVDNNVTPGVPFTYRVFTTLGNGTSGPWSNRVYMSAL